MLPFSTVITLGLYLTAFAATENTRYLRWEFSPEKYEQYIIVTFCDEEQAQRAVFEILPLYNGHPYALGSRWDDNHPNTLNMKQELEAAGMFGTWYLNGNQVPDPHAVHFIDIAR